MKIHQPSTARLQSINPNLVIYKVPWGWKVYDKSIEGRQYWDGLKRTAKECVVAVKRGLVPVRV